MKIEIQNKHLLVTSISGPFGPRNASPFGLAFVSDGRTHTSHIDKREYFRLHRSISKLKVGLYLTKLQRVFKICSLINSDLTFRKLSCFMFFLIILLLEWHASGSVLWSVFDVIRRLHDFHIFYKFECYVLDCSPWSCYKTIRWVQYWRCFVQPKLS